MTNPKPPADQDNAIQKLLELWKRRSQQAFPVDAMTINKCIRELEECIASEPATLQAKLDEANLLALSLQGQIVEIMAQPTEAWKLTYTHPVAKSQVVRVLSFDPMDSYSDFAPDYKVTELIPRVSSL